MKIPAADTLRQYEFTYLLPGTYTSDQVSATINSVEKLLSKYDFKVLSTEEWGKKSLAYPIKYQGKNQTDATYFHLVIEGLAGKVNELSTSVKLNQEILRYLIVIAQKPASDVSEVKEVNPTVEASID